MLINTRRSLKIIHKLSQSVNNINDRTDHLTEQQKDKLEDVIRNQKCQMSVVADIQTKT